MLKRNYRIAVLVGVLTVFTTTSTTIFAENISTIVELEILQSTEQNTIRISVEATIPIDDFVTAKLINSDGVIHMIWYKVNSGETTIFEHTFTDIREGEYEILVEYNDSSDSELVSVT